jgi:hypothetical protein
LSKTSLKSLLARSPGVASFLNFVRSIYELYYMANYLLNWSYFTVVPDVLGVIEPVLYFLVTVAMVGILITIGIKRHHGLWTDQC